MAIPYWLFPIVNPSRDRNRCTAAESHQTLVRPSPWQSAADSLHPSGFQIPPRRNQEEIDSKE